MHIQPKAPIPRAQGTYRLPVMLLGNETDEDLTFVKAMTYFEPHSNMREGDLAYLIKCPLPLRQQLQQQERLIPLIWKVRFVVSAWAFDLHKLAHTYPQRVAGVDHAIAMMADGRHHRAVIYAHAMPHGQWPDTACWFAENQLRKVSLREPVQEWPIILQEAKAPFIGYDTERIVRPFVFELAPDMYKSGENVGKPFEHEEATIHTACLLGMEPLLLGELSQGVDPRYIGDPRLWDPDHDILKGK
jgi:hypothetical protein